MRLQFNTIGFSSPFQISARKWLADLDEAHLVRNEALQAKQTQQSESPLKAAWIAAYAAIIAALVAIVACLSTPLVALTYFKFIAFGPLLRHQNRSPHLSLAHRHRLRLVVG